MEIVSLFEAGAASAAVRAAAVLRMGGVVLFPTDTLYGLGADALSDEAVAKIFSIKGRDEGKPIHALVSGLEMAAEYGEVSDEVRLLASRLPQGQVTFIVNKKAGFDTGIMRDLSTFGFRIPDNGFCLAFVRVYGKPVTATSANRSGEKPRRSADEILEQLGDAARHVDLVVDAGELPERQPSTVVDLSGVRPVILREGAVAAADVWDAIQARA